MNALSFIGLVVAIAGALAAPGASAQTIHADTVFRGGKILTVDAKFSVAQPVGIREGRFLAVGDDAEISAFIGPQTKVIELGGKTVVPGLMDRTRISAPPAKPGSA